MGGQAEQARGMAGTQTARGSVRDVLAALQNLEHLLRSPRVGPKALSQVIHEIRPSCQPIGDGIDALIEQISPRVAEPDRVAVLSPFTRRRAERLDAALVKAAASDMGARARLSLEVEVRQLRAELDAVRELIDLLDAAASFSPTELDVDALVTHALSVRAANDLRRPDVVRVMVEPCAGCTMVSDPRVIMPLIALGVAVAATAGGAGVHLTAEPQGADGLLTFVAVRDVTAGAIACVPPRVVAPTVDLTALAAREVGLAFDVGEGGRVQLTVPAAHVSQTAIRLAPTLRDVHHS